ncbi:hypothetical protein WA158_001543 [Blastocystis sp. Blastoise]
MSTISLINKNWNKIVLSCTSWFRVPELGMEKFEVLSRGSTFAVKADKNWETNYHFFAPFHVTAPYLFPGYYPTDKYPWLQAIHENHVIFTIELRDMMNGQIIKRLGADNRLYSHPSKDVCVIHLNKEGQALSELKEMGISINPLELSKQPVQKGEKYDEEKQEDVSILLPRKVPGQLLAASNHRIFAKTEENLTQGMCGGPVVDSRGLCRGITEGIVSSMEDGLTVKDPFLQKKLENCGVFIESTELIPFIEDIEKQRCVGQEEIEQMMNKLDEESKIYIENLKKQKEEEDEANNSEPKI